MKKIISIIIIICLSISFVGCSSQNNPEDTVENFFNYAKSFNLDSISNVFKDLDNDTEEMFEEISEGEELPDYLSGYLEDNAKKIDYKIIDSEIEKNEAEVRVDVKYTDAGKIIRETFGELFRTLLTESSDGEEITDEEIDKLFMEIMQKKINSGEEKIIEKRIKINLVESRGKWYIEEMNDELADIIMSGFIKAMEDFDSN